MRQDSNSREPNPNLIVQPTPTDWRPWLIIGGLFSGVLLSLVACGLLLAFILSRPPVNAPVTMIIAEAAYEVNTTAPTVGALLDELEMTLGEGDVLQPGRDTAITPNLIVRIERARDVTLTVNGQTSVVRTLFTNPVDIIQEAGIEVDTADLILVDGTGAEMVDLLVWPVPARQITIQQAVTVHIIDGDSEQSIETTSATVGEALFEAGVTLYLADVVSPDISTAITPDLIVTIQRSRPVTIIADGVSLETRAQGATVADALAASGVTLMGLDYTIPAEDTPLRPGMSVRVIRVTEQIESEQEVIPFESVYQADAELELDQQRLLQEGQNGIQQTNVRIRYENGIEISRTVESTTQAVEPLNRVLAYGTKVVIRTLDTPDGPLEYWRAIRVYATSYHPAALGGSNITATGRVLTKGIVGIDPRLIPYGTQLYVEGYGVGLAADTGARRHSARWIDLGYDDENWVSWSREVTVYLLTPIPAEIDYIMLP